MPNFDFLSDKEIIDIYKYIENESKSRNLALDSLYALNDFNCDSIVTDSIVTDAIDCTLDSPDSSNQNFIIPEQVGYTLYIPNLDWVNVDRFIKAKLEPIDFFVSVNSLEDFETLQSSIILYNYDAQIEGYINDSNLISFNIFDSNSKTPLPIDEFALLAVTGRKGDVFYIGFKEIKIQEGTYLVNLEQIEYNDLHSKVSQVVTDYIE
jgi:hypothetical protein